MHYSLLLALSGIPEKEVAANTFAVNAISHLKNKETKEGVSKILLDIQIRHLKQQLTNFSDSVYRAVDERLAPFSESNEDAFEFFKNEDVYRSWEKDVRETCFRTPEGDVVDAWDIPAGLLANGNLTDEAVSRGYEKVILPLSERYGSFDEYAGMAAAAECNPETGEYGYFCNPDAFFDWYEIGGRWPCWFLVRDDVKEFIPADCEDAPEGYRWCCAARKKDIDFKKMSEEFLRNKREEWEHYRAVFEGKLPLGKDPFCKITEGGVACSSGGPLYVKGETFDGALARMGFDKNSRYPVRSHNFLDVKDVLHDSEMYDGRKIKEAPDYEKSLYDFIDSLNGNDVLVGIDYHI